MKKLELILNKGLQEEFLVDLGRLQERIENYSINSPQVVDFKHLMMNKYNIPKKTIKANYLLYQTYIFNKNG